MLRLLLAAAALTAATDTAGAKDYNFYLSDEVIEADIDGYKATIKAYVSSVGPAAYRLKDTGYDYYSISLTCDREKYPHIFVVAGRPGTADPIDLPSSKAILIPDMDPYLDLQAPVRYNGAKDGFEISVYPKPSEMARVIRTLYDNGGLAIEIGDKVNDRETLFINLSALADKSTKKKLSVIGEACEALYSGL